MGFSKVWPLLVAGMVLSPGCQLASLSGPSSPGVTAVEAGPVFAETLLECEIKGLAEYGIVDLQRGACSPGVYVRACREAQQIHRERCQEFCTALKDVGGRRVCSGSSSPVARLFDSDRHCRELRHEQFEVSCEVRAECSCSASGADEG